MVGRHHNALSAFFARRRLSPTQRRLARYIIDNPWEAPFLSSVELAKKVGVSQPSVTRLATALGYKGYGELQKDTRRVLFGAAQGQAEERNKFQGAVVEEISNLEDLRDRLSDPGAVQALGRYLAGSEPLCVLGLRVSAPLAGYFGYFAKKIHPDVWLLTDGGSTIFDRLSHARSAGGEWMLCFLLPRHPRETLEVISYAKKLGLRVATITDQESGPATRESDITLLSRVGSQLVFDSQAAAMVLTEVLLEAIADASPERAQARLEDFEQRVTEKEVFASE